VRRNGWCGATAGTIQSDGMTAQRRCGWSAGRNGWCVYYTGTVKIYAMNYRGGFNGKYAHKLQNCNLQLIDGMIIMRHKHNRSVHIAL